MDPLVFGAVDINIREPSFGESNSPFKTLHQIYGTTMKSPRQRRHLLNLPVEIQLEIVSSVSLDGITGGPTAADRGKAKKCNKAQQSSLRSLGSTCKFLQALIDPLLYSSVEVGLGPGDYITEFCSELIQPSNERSENRLRYIKEIKFVTCLDATECSGDGELLAKNATPYKSIAMSDIPRLRDVLSSQGLDWKKSIDIDVRWLGAAVITILNNLSPGQLKAFCWSMGDAPDQKIIEHLLVHQPTVSILGCRITGSSQQDTFHLGPYLSGFAMLKSLDLRFNSRKWPRQAIPGILAANQNNLERFSLSFTFKSYDVTPDLKDAYDLWKLSNPGDTIQMRVLKSFTFESNPEALAFFRDEKLVAREQVEHIDAFMPGDDINTTLVGITHRPRRGILLNCFPDLKRLHITQPRSMRHNLLNRWGERYCDLLSRCIGTFDQLEELRVEGLWMKFDLKYITLPRTTLKSLELQIETRRVTYILDELRLWAAGFSRLDHVEIREWSAVVTKGPDGTFTRILLPLRSSAGL